MDQDNEHNIRKTIFLILINNESQQYQNTRIVGITITKENKTESNARTLEVGVVSVAEGVGVKILNCSYNYITISKIVNKYNYCGQNYKKLSFITSI